MISEMFDITNWNFDLLTDEDYKGYYALKEQLKEKRFNSIENFPKALDIIKKWCVRNEEADMTRCAVCGVIWFQHGICTQKRSLMSLTGKMYSTISRCIDSLGYHTTTSTICSRLLKRIPFFNEYPNETRYWCYRAKLEEYKTSADDELIKEIFIGNSKLKFSKEESDKDQPKPFSDNKQSSKKTILITRKKNYPQIVKYLEEISTWSCWPVETNDNLRFRPEP